MGKKPEIDEYRLRARGGRGVRNGKVPDQNGPVVALRAVTDDDHLMLITAKGTLLRMTLDQLREIGRATQGVKLIRVEDEEDRVVAVAKLAVDKDENGATDVAGPAAGEEAAGPPPADTPAELPPPEDEAPPES